MWADSEFSIQAWDTTAAVRWTIFGVSANGSVEVVSGSVEVNSNGASTRITKDHPDNGAVEAINSKIKLWAWELIETLKAEILSHDKDANVVTLVMNQTFKNDAQYLKVSGDGSNYENQITNDWSWDIDNIGRHIFNISDVDLADQASLAFCKLSQEKEVCTRPASTTTLFSYDLEKPTNDNKQCLARSYQAPSGITYNVPNSYILFTKKESLPLSTTGGQARFELVANCDRKTWEWSFREVSQWVVCDVNYAPNVNQTGCNRVLAKCDFNGAEYSDWDTVWAFQNKTSQSCAEKQQKTCDGLTGAFDKPSYSFSECNKWCVPPTGWLALSGQTKVEHAQTNSLTIYRDNIVWNSAVRFTRNALTGNVCQDWDMAFSTDQQVESVSYTDVQPWTSISSLNQQDKIDLTGEFSITIELNDIPTIGYDPVTGARGKAQYLLYKSNWTQDLKLFVVNESETSNEDKICFQREASSLDENQHCISPIDKITLSRDIDGFVFLNSQPTGLKLTGNYGWDLVIWNNVWFLPLTTDSRGVKFVMFAK